MERNGDRNFLKKKDPYLFSTGPWLPRWSSEGASRSSRVQRRCHHLALACLLPWLCQMVLLLFVWGPG